MASALVGWRFERKREATSSPEGSRGTTQTISQELLGAGPGVERLVAGGGVCLPLGVVWHWTSNEPTALGLTSPSPAPTTVVTKKSMGTY